MFKGWAGPLRVGELFSGAERVRCRFIGGRVEDKCSNEGFIEGVLVMDCMEFGRDLEVSFFGEECNREMAELGATCECFEKVKVVRWE